MRDTCAAPASYAIPLHRLALEDSDVDALIAALKNGLLYPGLTADNQRSVIGGVFGFFGRHAT